LEISSEAITSKIEVAEADGDQLVMILGLSRPQSYKSKITAVVVAVYLASQTRRD
jgi:hypothetical protein